MEPSVWNSLEVAKLSIGVLTPISVAVLGWFISRRMKAFEHVQWSNQKLIERRLSLYDELAPLLNRLLCFYTWVGYWKDVSPKDVIETKRALDTKVNIYRYLLNDYFYMEYQSFMQGLFVTYSGIGSDAKIRSDIACVDGDRTRDCNYAWDAKWNDRFAADSDLLGKTQIRDNYEALMFALSDSIGLPRAAAQRRALCMEQ